MIDFLMLAVLSNAPNQAPQAELSSCAKNEGVTLSVSGNQKEVAAFQADVMRESADWKVVKSDAGSGNVNLVLKAGSDVPYWIVKAAEFNGNARLINPTIAFNCGKIGSR
jgi:hypothetical protein